MRLTIPYRLKHGDEQGYILLIMMLLITVLAIAAAAVAPSVAFQVRRDREEELIHRGVQYSRAIRRYVKKFGRYPMRIEELEDTNNMRFLRKRYKDPVTGQDFKLLHLGEVQTTFGGGIAGATPVSALNAVPGVPTLGGAATGFGTQPQQTQPSPGGAITNTTAGSTNALDQNQNAAGQNPAGDENSAQPDSRAQRQTNSASKTTTPQTFGGGPIVGVVSTSKKESIRVFNKKNHYNQWQFIYDPNSDRGGLLNTPAQPPLQGVAPQVGQGQSGQLTGTAPGIQTGTSPQNPTIQPIQQQQQPQPEQQ
jgi:type II secretory pathway pseudopilin PulG